MIFNLEKKYSEQELKERKSRVRTRKIFLWLPRYSNYRKTLIWLETREITEVFSVKSQSWFFVRFSDEKEETRWERYARSELPPSF